MLHLGFTTMSILNQGRNEIRVNNSGAKCLLENWVEEVWNVITAIIIIIIIAIINLIK